MASPLNTEPAELTASYVSPASTKTFTQILPSSSTRGTEEKTAYLSILGRSMVQLQAEVNEYLTARMEDEKATASSNGREMHEQKEEQHYGEEIEEDV